MSERQTIEQFIAKLDAEIVALVRFRDEIKARAGVEQNGQAQPFERKRLPSPLPAVPLSAGPHPVEKGMAEFVRVAMDATIGPVKVSEVVKAVKELGFTFREDAVTSPDILVRAALKRGVKRGRWIEVKQRGHRVTYAKARSGAPQDGEEGTR